MALVGPNHTSGALNVTVAEEGDVGYYAPNGSIYITEVYNGSIPFFVTIAAGELSSDTGESIGLLLCLTKD